jgi:hypothetical protein
MTEGKQYQIYTSSKQVNLPQVNKSSCYNEDYKTDRD